jgi:hypothetical protein
MPLGRHGWLACGGLVVPTGVLLLGQKALRIQTLEPARGCAGRAAPAAPDALFVVGLAALVWAWLARVLAHPAERGLRAGLLGWQLALVTLLFVGTASHRYFLTTGTPLDYPMFRLGLVEISERARVASSEIPWGTWLLNAAGAGDHAGAARLGPPAARPRRASALSVRGSSAPAPEGHGRPQGTLRAGGAPGSWRCSGAECRGQRMGAGAHGCGRGLHAPCGGEPGHDRRARRPGERGAAVGGTGSSARRFELAARRRWPAAQRGVHLVGVHRRARHHAVQPGHADHARARALGERGHAGGERPRGGPAHQQGAGGHLVWVPAAHRRAHHRGAAGRAAGALPARPPARAGLSAAPSCRARAGRSSTAPTWWPRWASSASSTRARCPPRASSRPTTSRYEDDILRAPARAFVEQSLASGRPFVLTLLTGATHHDYREVRRYGTQTHDAQRRHAQPLAQRGAAPGPLHG